MTALTMQGRVIVAFERHLSLVKKGGNHCHINIVSIPVAAASKTQQVGIKVITPTALFRKVSLVMSAIDLCSMHTTRSP